MTPIAHRGAAGGGHRHGMTLEIGGT